jgi:hypothetical protein
MEQSTMITNFLSNKGETFPLSLQGLLHGVFPFVGNALREVNVPSLKIILFLFTLPPFPASKL